jgi:DNA sulfur modification protein DndB
MSAEQISTRIMNSKEIREAKALDDHLQRKLKPRVSKIVRYLKTRDSRFFNAIIIGVFDALPNWVQFNLSEVGGKLGMPATADIETSLGLLMFHGNEKMFAIDGQHRVEAIKEAFRQFPERVNADQFPVVFLAHVDDKSGKVRTRRLFCDINKNAVAVSEGDKVIIDEDEISAIVTRRIYAEYAHFNGGDEIAVTERKEKFIEDNRERFTSLLAVHTACKHLKKLFRKSKGSLGHDPENVARFQNIVAQFFDFVIQNEPSLNRYFLQRVTTPEAERTNNRNLFFRPIGLELLARLYVYFQPRQRLPVLVHCLTTMQFENPSGVLDGILWNAGRIEASAKARNAALEYCLYLLHELGPDDEASLLSSMREVTKNQAYMLPAKPQAPPAG